MAKRSDFAQKLLDDLRLRKERMASASQSSSQSQFHIDAYSSSKQTSTGSRNRNANGIIASRNGDMLNMSSRSYRSSNNGEVSNQIVSYGKGQSSLKMSDVSLALALAFENGGMPRGSNSSYNNSSAISFLHQFKRGGTMELSMIEKQGNLARQQGGSSNHFQALSPLQINEISKSAQKLNQILMACSNGFNIDRYSLEIAKELFQGAIDLEQSLRVLVDLQHNSEFMVTSQKKNRITILDEDTDDDDNDEDNKMIRASEQNQLAPPIFSFDKPSRHSLMQSKIVVTNSKEGRNSYNRKQDGKMSKASSQKQQTRSSSDYKNLNTVSEQKNQSALAKSKAEKGRIPNVIAKLMGLDSLPDKAELNKQMAQKDSGNNTTQKVRGNHRGIAFQHTAKESAKKAEPNRKETENSVTMKKQKLIEAFNMPETRDEELVFSTDKNSVIQKAGSKVVVENGKPLWNDPYGIRTVKDFDNGNTKINKQHNIGENQTDLWVKGRKQDPANAENAQQKSMVKGRTNDPTLNNMLSQMELVKVKSPLQEEKEINVSNVQLVKRDTNKQTMNNQKKSQNSLGVQKSHMMSKNGPQEEKHRREQQREKQMSPVRPQISLKSQPQFIDSPKKQQSVKQNFAENAKSMKLEGFLSIRHDDLVKHEASNDIDGKVKEINRRKLGDIIAMVDEKSVHKLANVKAKNTRKQKVDVPSKTGEKLNERNGRKLITEQVEQEIHTLQEPRQGKPERFNVLKVSNLERVGMLKKADAAEAMDHRLPPHKEAELAPNDLDHAAAVVAHGKFKTGESPLDTMNGTNGNSMSNNNHSKLNSQNISRKRIQEPLTESENHLKKIFITSQSFLNTAEALFRLNIPFSILKDGDHDSNSECNNKLILDCAYEVMKRKGISTEIRLNPCSKISISAINITSLDDLVRHLNKDMEKLKFYGRDRSSLANNIEDYLPKMLEHDVYNREPDIDSMWDFGWNDETFAFVEQCDVVKDMEKHVLNVLLDDITRDLWIVQGGLKLKTMH